ncbi:MAG: EF-P lysine aminoacylase EpmA [Alphaproteobacteria bacterium]
MTPWWDKDAFAAKRPYLQARAAMTGALRGYFAAKDFLEVETPALQVSPGLEPHLQAFGTTLTDPYGGPARPMYLHTSPEFAMKKLLAAGLPRIFQIAPVFRDGERSDTHHPAFSMIEWYRAGEPLAALIDDCGALLRATWQAAPEDLRKGGLRWKGKACDPMRRPEVLTVAEAFRRHAQGLDILATAPDPTNPSVERLRDAATHAGLKLPESGDWEDLFFHIFLEHIEPKLGIGAPTALVDYPLSMAALAKKSARDPRVADRMELYVAGLELANGFAELTDAAEQRRRFEADMEKKQRLYGERYPLDEDFLAALAEMPDASGIALGFDRLVMLATGADKIDDVLWAPVA